MAKKKKKKKPSKKSNPPDLTLRNLHAEKKRIKVMTRELRDLGRRVSKLEKLWRKG